MRATRLNILGRSTVPGRSEPSSTSVDVGADVDVAPTCLVAVDASDASVDALVWALRHAHVRGMRVEILTVWPPHGSVMVHEVPGHNAARWSAREAQEDAVRRALQQVPYASVAARRLENADAVTALVRASSRAELVVLGASPHEERHSFTRRVVDGAACAVVVVVAH